jgi:post-segregation antitoxin (ccd killing protein)
MEDTPVNDMGKKERTTIHINGEIKRKARELGLNISKVAENALKRAIAGVSNALRNQELEFERGRKATQRDSNPEEPYRPVEPGARVQIPAPAPLL